MIEQLFGSKTRVKLLQLFYSNPNRSFYVREITRKIDEQINSVRRELANLLNVGIIVSDTTNNKLYYEVNQGFEHYQPLKSIFGSASKVPTRTADNTTKAHVPATNEQEKIKLVGNIDLAIFVGQFTRDESSGIDLLIVGDINQNALQKFVSDLEAREGKDIRFTSMPTTEFQYRRQINDRFITTVLESKKQILIDKNSIL
ncbi:MAG TPA: transcriptional regulator [Candidatus Saccharimonadales bacterium]|nr:transcriptional regulator [Candidatus Saccharimonadales bacterium]